LAKSVFKEAAPFVGEAAGLLFSIGALEKLFKGSLFSRGGGSGNKIGDVVRIAETGGSMGKRAGGVAAGKNEGYDRVGDRRGVRGEISVWQQDGDWVHAGLGRAWRAAPSVLVQGSVQRLVQRAVRWHI
jgi:hypothetical protein